MATPWLRPSSQGNKVHQPDDARRTVSGPSCTWAAASCQGWQSGVRASGSGGDVSLVWAKEASLKPESHPFTLREVCHCRCRCPLSLHYQLASSHQQDNAKQRKQLLSNAGQSSPRRSCNLAGRPPRIGARGRRDTFFLLLHQPKNRTPTSP